MSENAINDDRLLDLAEAACDKSASNDDLVELDSVLLTDHAARWRYLDYCWMRVTLKLETRASEAAQKVREQIDIETAGALSRSSDVQGTQTAFIAPLPLVSATYHDTVGWFSSGWPVAYLVATVIFGVGALIGSIVQVSQPTLVARHSPSSSRMDAEPAVEIVGRITSLVDCRWGENPKSEIRNPKEIIHPKSEIINQNSLVSLGDRFALASGLLEITYDTGAKVILQGPVTYEVESRDGGYLAIGKLTARLDKGNDEARMTNDEEKHESRTTNDRGLQNSSFVIRPSSFAIRTPTAVVTDLGTEFGVEVNKEGHTVSRVFRGTVEVRMVSANGKAVSSARVLHENESARVENDTGKPASEPRVIVFVDPPTQPAEFVREIPKPTVKTIKTFDLVDVVAGGDGFSGRRNRGITPTDARVVMGPEPGYERPTGDHRYHPVNGVRFVDGVFIPDGSQGPVQTDSAGHTCDMFLPTSNTTTGYIWAGGPILTGTPDPIPAEFDGVDYSKPGHGLLFLHANKAITFDLDAIRRANPTYRVLRFQAVGGNVGFEFVADFCVLVDGQMRFRRRQINNTLGGMPVTVPIGQSDRFLTLAATDGGDDIKFDWIMFGDPRLEMLDAGGKEARRVDIRK